MAAEPTTTATEAVCYRHPQRAAGLKCTHCGRYICTQCARPTDVGYRCPDCLYELRPRHFPKGLYLDPLAAPETRPILTYVLVASLVTMYALQEYLGGSTNNETLIRLGALHGEHILQGEVWRLV